MDKMMMFLFLPRYDLNENKLSFIDFPFNNSTL